MGRGRGSQPAQPQESYPAPSLLPQIPSPPPRSVPGLRERRGHPARNRLCPPSSSLPRGTFVHLLQPSSADKGAEWDAGRGAGGACLGPSRHSRPPHAPSSQRHPGAGRQLGRAVLAPGSPPRPLPRAPSCSSSPACAATPAWTGPAPTSGSRSGSWRAPSGRPAWTPEVGGQRGAPRGRAGWGWIYVGGGLVVPGWVCPPSPALRPPRVPQASAVPEAAGGQREHGPGGPGPPSDRHHPVHCPHG